MLIIELLDQYKKFAEVALAFAGTKLNKSFQKTIIEILILYMVIPRKINFLQMERYGDCCEQCYRQAFGKSVDWLRFNMSLSAYAFRDGARRVAIAMDPCYIPKAGKHTPHAGTFWSGCAGAAKHGQEILGIGVIDVDLHDCMMLKAVQTALAPDRERDELSLYGWYAKVLVDNKDEFQRISNVIVADAAFSKCTFTDKVLPEGYHVLSRLRNDAVLHYEWTGAPTGKPGRPRVKGARIDFDSLDMAKAIRLGIDPGDGETFHMRAHCKSLGRVVSLVVLYLPNGGYRLFFCIDADMPGIDVYKYYRTRFQIEFNYRDAKQFTGLADCQGRDERKLDFAFNASLAAVNIAKAVRRQIDPNLSVGRKKSLMVNAHYLMRIIRVFGKKTNMTLNIQLVKDLFGAAAVIAYHISDFLTNY